MSEVLEEVKDWETLASTLELKTSQQYSISGTCSNHPTPVQCQRRMLVRTYCDMMGLVDAPFVAESIAQALISINKPEVAETMRQLYHHKGNCLYILI